MARARGRDVAGPPSAPDLDALVAAGLAAIDLTAVHEPLVLARWLRDAWAPLQFAIVEMVGAQSVSAADLRFDTLVSVLREGAPALAFAATTRLAEIADGLAGRREPFDRSRLSMDAGRHAQISVSGPEKGRMLAAVVRFMRSRSVIEIGTAYGLSALYLALELEPDGVIATLEGSEPQATIAAEVLCGCSPARCLKGWSGELVDDVRVTLAGKADLLFHDGGHSEESYLADFAAYEPLLAPGAVVIFDDIHWDDPAFTSTPARTYEGWTAVIKHPRVRRAVELNGAFGMLQLR